MQRDYLVGQVHELEDKMDSAFASIEEFLGVKACLSADITSVILLKARPLSY